MQTEYIHEMKSRPVYSPVELKQNATLHLFVAVGETPQEMARLIESCSDSQTLVISADNIEQAHHGLSEAIPMLPLATSVYVAGSEAFLWAIAEQLREAGMAAEQIQLFSPSTKAREVFCCHCYGVTAGVTHSPAQCSGCQRLLAVTDHFSKKHGAYMGYQINAEDPNDIPEAEELS